MKARLLDEGVDRWRCLSNAAITWLPCNWVFETAEAQLAGIVDTLVQ